MGDGGVRVLGLRVGLGNFPNQLIGLAYSLLGTNCTSGKKFSAKNKKDLVMACHIRNYSTPRKSEETRRNAFNQAQSHPL